MMPKSGVVERYWPGLVIVGNMGVLWVCERYGGLRVGGLYEGLAWLVSLLLPIIPTNGNLLVVIAAGPGRAGVSIRRDVRAQCLVQAVWCKYDTVWHGGLGGITSSGNGADQHIQLGRDR